MKNIHGSFGLVIYFHVPKSKEKSAPSSQD
jgi:hypothetical protein